MTMYCRKCRYQLDGLVTDGPHCPECGTPFDPANPDTYSTVERPLLTKSLQAGAAVVLVLILAASCLVLPSLLYFLIAAFNAAAG